MALKTETKAEIVVVVLVAAFLAWLLLHKTAQVASAGTPLNTASTGASNFPLLGQSPWTNPTGDGTNNCNCNKVAGGAGTLLFGTVQDATAYLAANPGLLPFWNVESVFGYQT